MLAFSFGNRPTLILVPSFVLCVTERIKHKTDHYIIEKNDYFTRLFATLWSPNAVQCYIHYLARFIRRRKAL